ncbi:MAG: hypothetical protein ABIJ08_01905, partial [Nanoarchaeota archaeon]
MKTKLLLLMLVLLVGCSSLPIGPKPEITVVYDFPVNSTIDGKPVFNGSITPISVSGIMGIMDDVDLEASFQDNDRTIMFEPAEDLPKGNYTFTVQVQGINGIWGGFLQTNLVVERQAINITIIQPPFGVSYKSEYDVIITTLLPAQCKWSYGDQSYSLMVNEFTSTGTTHTIQNFNRPAANIYVGCNVSEENKSEEIYYKNFNIYVDSTPPIINYQHADDILQYLPGGILLTTLVINTDDETVCRYSSDSSLYNYDQM